jgi:hypothetical protein
MLRKVPSSYGRTLRSRRRFALETPPLFMRPLKELSMAKQKNSVEMSPSAADPMLLGVSMPLAVTKTKAGEIAMAWRECLTALMAVAKTKVKPEKSASAAAPEASPQASTISA